METRQTNTEQEQQKIITPEELSSTAKKLIINETPTDIIYADPAWEKIAREIKTAVLILDAKNYKGRVVVTGETGTGKELICRALHNCLNYGDERPFVPINCGAMPENLAESNLFGHEQGSFTSAIRRAPGAFEQAKKGTLFLDEIGDLDLSLQVKLLRALEERKIYPVGSFKAIDISDVAVICATNRDLKTALEENLFRRDLWHRISGTIVNIPPLRERPEDIPVLISHFLNQSKEIYLKNKQIKLIGLTSKAFDALKNYTWPGNARELANVVTNLALTCHDKSAIDFDDIPEEIRSQSKNTETPARIEAETENPAFGQNLIRANIKRKISELIKYPQTLPLLKDMNEMITKIYIEQTLSSTGGNKKEAAILLGINRTTLVEMMKRLKLS